MATQPSVFIDGEAGTTGLQIYTRLAQRDDLTLVSIDPDKRKDNTERARLLNSVDVAILCLPDEAAIEAVALVTNPQVKILDASSAHRTATGWAYGFPEMHSQQRSKIASAHRVSNPGCYPTGFIGCMHPLVAQGLIPTQFAATINAVSGYSGGGRGLIEVYEQYWGDSNTPEAAYPYGIYGLGFGHKHIQEMHLYSGLAHAPLFAPAVGAFAQGMLVQIPLPLWSFENTVTGEALQTALAEHYAHEPFVQVLPLNAGEELRDRKFLDIKNLNNTNLLQLFVFANDKTQEALLVARLDNLGKGASGAAVQNLNLMLGLNEHLGLT
jgi:N-acetyl-gamma-glutamyl-phosphate reductase